MTSAGKGLSNGLANGLADGLASRLASWRRRPVAWGCAIALAWGIGGILPIQAKAAASVRGRAEVVVQTTPLKKTKKSGASALQAAESRARWLARQRALELAIDQLGVDIEPALRQRLLAQHEAWTSSYRLASSAREGEKVAAEVDVDIDIAKLRRAILPPVNVDAAQASPVLAAQEVTASCAPFGLTSAAMRAAWQAAGGAIEGDGVRYRTQAACRLLGAVSQTRWLALRLELSQATSEPVSALGFGVNAEQALASALARGMNDVVAQLAVSAAPLEVVVIDPWPALVLRQLEQALRSSVAGVRSVTLSGMRGDGSAVLLVAGSRDAASLILALGELTLPAATVEKAEILAPRRIALRLRPRPDAADPALQSVPDDALSSSP